MAICEICGREVAPIDVWTAVRAGSEHFFCSAHHRREFEEAKTPAKAAEKSSPPLVSPAEASEAGRVLETRGEQLAEASADEAKKLSETPKRRPGRPKKSS